MGTREPTLDESIPVPTAPSPPELERVMASEPSPAFQFYPLDFLGDRHVLAMTLEARGAYITLLCICWRDHFLPLNPRLLAQIVGVPAATFQARLWPQLLPCFTWTEHGYQQKRIERERLKQTTFREAKSRAGQLGNAKRWGPTPVPAQPLTQPSHSDADATRNPVANGRSSSSSSSSSTAPPENGGAAYSHTRPIHGPRNPDLLTHRPLKLWASQFRDEIVPLVATHYDGDRDKAYAIALQWVGEVDTHNLTTAPSTDALANPKQFWTDTAAQRWGVDPDAAGCAKFLTGGKP